MTRTTVVRGSGAALLLGGVLWIAPGPDVGGGVGKLVSFVAGAIIGGGFALLLTGTVRPWSGHE